MRVKDENGMSEKTVRTLFEEAVENLHRAGVEDATREAEILLCHVLKKDRVYLYAYGKNSVDESTCHLFSVLLSERMSGKPLQYILGTAEFMGLTLEVNSAVLIPRQDTELLAETAIAELSRRSEERKISRQSGEKTSDSRKRETTPFEVLDLCTGSGALAIAIAKLAEGVCVTASDISAEALSVAKRNADSANLLRPIRFFEGDLFAALPTESTFDMIISNPPYIVSAVVDTLEIHVRDHEPRNALDGGTDGMDFVKRILGQAPFLLNPGSVLLMEIGYDQGARALALATATESPFAKARILKDFGGNDRVLIAHTK
jgi:release factor glutamine methyltransferase